VDGRAPGFVDGRKAGWAGCGEGGPVKLFGNRSDLSGRDMAGGSNYSSNIKVRYVITNPRSVTLM